MHETLQILEALPYQLPSQISEPSTVSYFVQPCPRINFKWSTIRGHVFEAKYLIKAVQPISSFLK